MRSNIKKASLHQTMRHMLTISVQKVRVVLEQLITGKYYADFVILKKAIIKKVVSDEEKNIF